jgi:dipeptidyl aminopeptidase/acylaminoacyl peptidase
MIGRLLIILCLLGLAASPASAQTDAPDGTLLSSEPCPPNPIRSHEDFVRTIREDLDREVEAARKRNLVMPPISDARLAAALPGRAIVEEQLAYRGFECRVISYASGGLRIGGLIWKPIDTQGKRLPLLIALRGGNAMIGGMAPWFLQGWHDFLKAGYVVIATQYRGGPGSDGTDTYGSRGDLDDVRNLVPLAAALGYVDTSQVFVFGGSRGGMQAYMLAREGFPMRAMAIRAGAGNVRDARRPTLMQLITSMMPDYAADPEGALDRRSPVLWADEIKVPTILFHGTADWRVPVEDALGVAQGLAKAGTPFALHIYEGDTHSLTLNLPDVIARTLAFFDQYRAGK